MDPGDSDAAGVTDFDIKVLVSEMQGTSEPNSPRLAFLWRLRTGVSRVSLLRRPILGAARHDAGMSRVQEGSGVEIGVKG